MARSSYEMFLAPSSPRLPLSTDFVRELLEKKILEGPIILHTKGGHSWRLEIKQINDTYYFTNGWNNVVEDMQLRFGDYLYFRPLDQSTIKMSIFRPKECNRFLAPKVKHKDDDDPFFTSIITKTHTKMLRFPGGFAELAGINAQGTMTLKNLDGKEWLVGLRLDKAFRTKRLVPIPYVEEKRRPAWCNVGSPQIFRSPLVDGMVMDRRYCASECTTETMTRI
ncbi:uncharacterized protein LOC110931004 isoform X2 [Helianthus annuus]|uniref:uncharacterized protein LOC110931004 isoform X2 n=1 Tax=Helianthus annuus TaxID=4232 RepID=UPI000B8F1F94|nr:uncharacterized protein LOC110931004 isoform X2 [Helianthus annuus]